ncbi:MAG: SH3 domain-containing protein [Rhodanobacter sp.]|jgi:uncharacterized protein YraI
MKRLIWGVLASLLLAVPTLAQAAVGYVTGNVNLRAGPDSSYPLIAQIGAGTDVDVQGCTAGWEWCDVIVYNNRGWIAGNYIQYDYQDQYVPLPSYGARIGVPIISFVIGTYWDNYYRGRPFYNNRSYWYRRPYVRRPPPPPVRRPYVRPNGQHGGAPVHRPPAVQRPAPAYRPAPHGQPQTRPAPNRQMSSPAPSSRAASERAPQRNRPPPSSNKAKPSDRKRDHNGDNGH